MSQDVSLCRHDLELHVCINCGKITFTIVVLWFPPRVVSHLE